MTWIPHSRRSCKHARHARSCKVTIVAGIWRKRPGIKQSRTPGLPPSQFGGCDSGVAVPSHQGLRPCRLRRHRPDYAECSVKSGDCEEIWQTFRNAPSPTIKRKARPVWADRFRRSGLLYRRDGVFAGYPVCVDRGSVFPDSSTPFKFASKSNS